MGSLSGILGSGAGVGPGKSPTGVVAAPAASDRSSSIVNRIGAAEQGVTQGRISLAVLNGGIIIILLFYLWTHRVQGGG
jgi:hypothetical protein